MLTPESVHEYLFDEVVHTTVEGELEYVAGCPDCGRDATWRDLLIKTTGAKLGVQVTTQTEMNCSFCDVREY